MRERTGPPYFLFVNLVNTHGPWLVVLLLVAAGPARAAMTGQEVYEQACASCHGVDGKGAPVGTGIEVPLPDLSDCKFVTAESTANWSGLVQHGGHFLGLSSQMPGFGDALSDEDVRAVIDYLRGFCTDGRWPIGDLNFRRPLFVGKGFPEDEITAVFTPEFGRHETTWAGELAGEMRIGPRGWLEVALPVESVDPDDARSTVGVGDVAIAYRQAFIASRASRTLVSAGVDLAVPTGNFRNGVGAGTAVVKPQVLGGQALGPLVLQAQVLAELPGDPARADRQMLYRIALQAPAGPYKKNLVPAVEFQQSQALDSPVRAATLLGPTLYVPLSRRGHVALSVGAQFPVAGTRPFDWRFGTSLLWEYRDGPFWAW